MWQVQRVEMSAEDLQDGSETHCDFLCGDGGTERKTGGQGGGLQIFTGSEQEEIRNDLTDSLGVMEDIGQRMMKMEEEEEEVV